MTFSHAEKTRINHARIDGDRVVAAFDHLLNAKDGAKGIKSAPADVSGVSGNRLKSFIERVERLEEEKKALTEDIRDVYAEAKSAGFDTKIMRKLILTRKLNIEKRREERDLFEIYCSALGMEV